MLIITSGNTIQVLQVVELSEIEQLATQSLIFIPWLGI
jgi:hypothetical protein